MTVKMLTFLYIGANNFQTSLALSTEVKFQNSKHNWD